MCKQKRFCFFPTSTEVADGRLETLISIAVNIEIPFPLIKVMSTASSMEEALTLLESRDPVMVQKLWRAIAEEVERRSIAYVNHYFSSSMKIGAILFDRKRQPRWHGSIARKQMLALGVNAFT